MGRLVFFESEEDWRLVKMVKGGESEVGLLVIFGVFKFLV